ncbi:uncharacterized protein TM35_000151870 [Trypanosoma theileri]|uniref:Uncharacterized protein n=1 Tax=Trypanosoma theileri TaxID=67003 RepID=A0A1X0NVL9_9TRYP|nr:uncharacterized protein TM35_000151870 [Trypanosoma theileri]ORC88756.1 hypothetical protein TM35_000151870 [Trypanosoma theileri]
MWSEADHIHTHSNSSSSYVDALSHFQSHRGLRTSGYKLRNHSQIVLGDGHHNNNTLNNHNNSSGVLPVRRRERGPGKEFGRFVEMFGFPEKRPQPFSQKRIFVASATPSSLHVFQRTGEVMLDSNGRPYQQEELEEHVNVSSTQETELYADNVTIEETEERIKMLEKLLMREKKRLQVLKEKQMLQNVKTVSPDILKQQLKQQQQEEEDQHWKSDMDDGLYKTHNPLPCSHTASDVESGYSVPTSLPASHNIHISSENNAHGIRILRNQRRGNDDDEDGNSYKITPKITENPSLSSRSREFVSQSNGDQQSSASPTPPRERIATATRATTAYGRSSWTLARHYAGWR